MRPTSQPPRDYQIAELTRGIQLPLPPLNRRHIKVIAEFLAEAWNGLRISHEQVLCTKEEKEINALMESRMDDIRVDKPEWSMLVTGVSRGKESVSYDGKSLEKRPDLSVHLTNRPFRFPLVVECKLIDKRTRKNVDKYCDNGIARFIDGEYAWYGHEAFMLAYVRDNSAIEHVLTPYLSKNQHNIPDSYLTEQLPNTINIPIHKLAQSRHGRRFSNNPGSIAVWHLWLS
jgi:hypothetical protein